MNYKKFLHGVGTLTICFMLTGCGHEHTWTEATCTEPKTCSECGETEGEALGHSWADATCSAPKTCSICKETEGEALGHSWEDATCSAPKTCSICKETEGNALEHILTEANYQQAAVCEVCGEAVGEPLQADFEKYNFTYVTEIDKEYPFATKCYDSDDWTTGTITFYDYQIFTSDDEHEAKEGYEWRTVTFTIIFDDENAMEYGHGGWSMVALDFYDGCTFSDEESEEDDEDDFFTVNYNGTDYTECIYDSEWVENQWIDRDDGTWYYEGQMMHTFRLPVGYDGQTLSVFDVETRDKLGDSVNSAEQVMLIMENENTVTFRLQ